MLDAGNSEAASLMQLMAQAAQASPDDYISSVVYGMLLTLLYPNVPRKPIDLLLCISTCLCLQYLAHSYSNKGS